MSLESVLDRIAVALEAQVALAGGTVAKKGPGRPAVVKETPDLTQTGKAVETAATAQAETVAAKGPTREQVQKAVTDNITAGYRDAVVAILKKYGGTNVSTCKPEDYTAIKAELDGLAVAG